MIIDHITVLSPQTLAADGAATTQTKTNANFSLGQSEASKIEGRLEHSNSSLHGEGLLSVPTVTYSAASLQATFGAFTCLIGSYLSYPGGTATLLANQTGASLYFQNDLTFATATGTKSYFVIGTYSSDATGITAFALTNKLLLPKLVTLADTVAGIYVPDNVDYADYYVDHSAAGIVAVDGVLTLTVSPDSDFYVEELYSTGVVATTSDTQNSPPHNRTEKGFHVRITRRAGYLYASHPTADLTYSRTCLAIAA